MSVPVITFFNNKGGVGKTSLAYHLAWMFSEMGVRVLAVDLDPQSNLTAWFLSDERLASLWQDDRAPTISRRARAAFEKRKGAFDVDAIAIRDNLWLLAGDPDLSKLEEPLSREWSKSVAGDARSSSREMLTVFRSIIIEAGRKTAPHLILVDTGPNLGSINRSTLIASDFVVLPLRADLFSLWNLRNLGSTLWEWRETWARDLAMTKPPSAPVCNGRMTPIGYVVPEVSVYLSRRSRGAETWLARIPFEYRRSILRVDTTAAPKVDEDPECLAILKHFHSLVPMSMEARKPIFMLNPADGAIGAHMTAVQGAYACYRVLAEKLLARSRPSRVSCQEEQSGAP